MSALLTFGSQQAGAQKKQSGTNSFTYGSHVFTMEGNFSAESYNQNATGCVTFSNIPSDYDEFEAVYTQFLGKTPHGAAAMMPMAMESEKNSCPIAATTVI